MAFLTVDSPISVVLIVLFLLGGATIGITIMAAVFSELLRVTFSSAGEPDEELLAGEGEASTAAT
jgi:hypothetical protein